jgi:hypothetical protein
MQRSVPHSILQERLTIKGSVLMFHPLSLIASLLFRTNGKGHCNFGGYLDGQVQ